MKTPYGSVLPSSLFSESEIGGISAFNKRYKNHGLKMGVVTKVIPPEDVLSVSGFCMEYNVLVVEQEQDTGYDITTYKNCIKLDNFGGVADYFDSTLREPTKVGPDGVQDLEKQNGSIVVIQCLDGSSSQAIIKGGVQHPKRKPVLNKETGHSMIGRFNGVSLEIDKEGAFSISFAGATDNDGKPIDEKVGGSSLKITKNGSVEITDGAGETISFDKEKNKVLIQSKKDVSIDSGELMALTAGKDFSVATKAKMVLEASGEATIKSAGLKCQIGGEFKIDSKGMDIKAGSQLKAQAAQITLDGMVNLGGPGGTPAVLMSTMGQGIGNLGGPVIVSFIGPFSSKVKLM